MGSWFKPRPRYVSNPSNTFFFKVSLGAPLTSIPTFVVEILHFFIQLPQNFLVYVNLGWQKDGFCRISDIFHPCPTLMVPQRSAKGIFEMEKHHVTGRTATHLFWDGLQRFGTWCEHLYVWMVWIMAFVPFTTCQVFSHDVPPEIQNKLDVSGDISQ